MQCARCGYELEPGDNACPKCGKSVEHETAAPPGNQSISEPGARQDASALATPQPALGEPASHSGPSAATPLETGDRDPAHQRPVTDYGAPQVAPLQQGYPPSSGTGYPGGLPYGQPDRPAWVSTIGDYVSTQGRGTALFIMLSLMMVFDVLATISDLAQISMLQQAASGVQISEQAALANDARQGLIGLAVLGIYLVTAIVWCVWIHRADKNLPAFGARNLRFTPGWAVGWYFVPFLNLVRPYQVMQEICQASDPNTPVHSGTEWMSSPTPPLVGFWWGAYLINGFLGNAVLRSSMGAKSPEELISSTWIGIVSQAVSIVATILAIMMVRKVNAFQAEKYNILASQAQKLSPF